MKDELYMEATLAIKSSAKRAFDAWSNAEQLNAWWGPPGMSAKWTLDFKVGGKWSYVMSNAEGTFEMHSAGEFLEIKPNELIVSNSWMTDSEGKKLPASLMGVEDWPDESQVHTLFSEQDGITTVTIRHGPIPPSEGRDRAQGGWQSSLGKLEQYLTAN